MYLHLGNNYVIPEREIIGIFDMDNTTISKHTSLSDFAFSARRTRRTGHRHINLYRMQFTSYSERYSRNTTLFLPLPKNRE